VSFATITLYVASQRVLIVVAYFVIDSVRKLLDTPSYMSRHKLTIQPNLRGILQTYVHHDSVETEVWFLC
jgi:hypothetical protein